MKALVIGGVSLDTIIHVDALDEIRTDTTIWAKDSYTSIGGTGAGKALALATLGVNTTLITALGKDRSGREIISFIEDKNIKIRQLNVTDTENHTNIMHSNGKRLSIYTSYPQKEPQFNEIDYEKDIITSDIVFLNINNFCRRFIPLLKKYKKPMVVDLHDYNPPNPYHQEFIEAADYLITSGENIKNHEQYLKSSISSGKLVSIITLGDKGLIALDKSYKEYKLKAFNTTDIIDSNGAGDSFCAGFVIKLFESNNVLEALKFGNICGGIACTSHDLFNLDYTKSKIEHILQNKKS